MGEWLVRLFGSGAIDPSSPMVRFEFAHPLALWQWGLVLAGGAMLAWWSYARLEGSGWIRIAAGVARWCALVLIVLVLCGPRLVQVDERIERDWVLALVDRSASMTIADAPGGGGSTRQTREAQLRSMLEQHRPALAQLAQGRTLKWLGFDASTYELSGTPLPTLTDPAGRRTDLAEAVEQALAKGAARPIAGIVVFSDGRASGGREVPRVLLKRLSAEKVPVVVVPLGSDEGAVDVSVGSVVAPPTAFVNDPVPVRASVSRSGGRTPPPTRVRLIDKSTGETLDETTVEWADSDTNRPLTLTGRAKGGQAADWSVVIEPPADAADLIEGNNNAPVRIDLVDRPLRLLYADGYPRWEYRFLKNILSRDESVEFNALLLSAGRRYVQEGSGGEGSLDALPDTAAGWDAVDVIMLGDVQAGVISTPQMEQIRARVSVGGAGLLWIGGQGAVPGAYRGTPLADLLPVSSGQLSSVAGGGSGVSGLPAWDQDVVLKPTPVAESLGVLRLAERQPDGSYWPAGVSDPATGWSRLRWVQRLDPAVLKPAAEPLALAQPIDGGPAMPMLVTMRYGAGRIVYLATDEIWRYRFGRGEDLPERFYMQLIRLLGRESVARAGKPAVLTLTPREPEVGAAVRVSLDLIDQALVDAKPTALTVRIARSGSPEDRIDVPLKPTGDGSAGGSRSFVGTWVPPAAGTWTGVATDTLLEGKDVSATAQVTQPDDELRRPETDHPLLRSLAQETGGTVLNAESLGTLKTVLPNREVRTLNVSKQETLWDRPGVLILLITLLGVEWVLRRLIRLI